MRNKHYSIRLTAIMILAALLPWLNPVCAQDEKSDISELAKQSQNPVANMYQLPVSWLGDFNSGPGKNTVSTFALKPVIPVTLTPKLLLIARAIVPFTVISAPDADYGLSDVQIQFYFSPVSKGKFIWGAGPMLTVPSGIPHEMCSGKWTAGPAAAGLFMFRHVVVGALVTQRWSFAGIRSADDINQLYIDAFVNYNFKHGWSLGYTPEIYVNWNKPGDAWNLPLGLNVSKVFRIKKQPLSVSLAYFYNVIRPEDYTDMYVKAGLTFLFPKKAK